MRVIGAIAMRFGTVSPLRETGRERISAARDGAGGVMLTWGTPRDDGPVGMCTCIECLSHWNPAPHLAIPPPGGRSL
ncbi:hypothetical protein Saso_34260 [Streptomyces asoensis]|uniref:Uncharacterized protein n=1 Tax=Streptomyces asoensis TaxID=249586 RepID=A0ABQ3S0X0_9ACTN|nr:hypothetical protein GCM10010496_27610 [Streptomyces asoensis]GHI61776.1 hypothetical protein Saso_34260 [Streptomyces asoensis]